MNFDASNNTCVQVCADLYGVYNVHLLMRYMCVVLRMNQFAVLLI